MQSVSIKDLASYLAIPNFGRNKIFRLLRDHKILDLQNVPYKKYVDLGYFVVISEKYKVETVNGPIDNIYFKTTVTSTGIDFVKDLAERQT